MMLGAISGGESRSAIAILHERGYRSRKSNLHSCTVGLSIGARDCSFGYVVCTSSSIWWYIVRESAIVVGWDSYPSAGR